jgi:pyruvate dehydrogenase (quinone)
MGRTVAEQLVEMLKAAGIRRIYGVTGDSLNFFNDALRRDGSIDLIHVRHEESAAYAANFHTVPKNRVNTIASCHSKPHKPKIPEN